MSITVKYITRKNSNVLDLALATSASVFQSKKQLRLTCCTLLAYSNGAPRGGSALLSSKYCTIRILSWIEASVIITALDTNYTRQNVSTWRFLRTRCIYARNRSQATLQSFQVKLSEIKMGTSDDASQ